MHQGPRSVICDIFGNKLITDIYLHVKVEIFNAHKIMLLIFLSYIFLRTVYDECKRNYLVEKDKQYSARTEQINVSDDGACRTKCDSEVSCIAFEMDSNTTPNKCYLVSDPAASGTATTGVNHYKRTRACPFKITSESKSANIVLFRM